MVDYLLFAAKLSWGNHESYHSAWCVCTFSYVYISLLHPLFASASFDIPITTNSIYAGKSGSICDWCAGWYRAFKKFWQPYQCHKPHTPVIILKHISFCTCITWLETLTVSHSAMKAFSWPNSKHKHPSLWHCMIQGCTTQTRIQTPKDRHAHRYWCKSPLHQQKRALHIPASGKVQRNCALLPDTLLKHCPW